MPENPEVLLNQVLTQYRFDRDAARTALGEQEAAQKDQLRLQSDLQKLSQEQLGASLDAQKQKRVQALQEIEEATKRHYGRLAEEEGISAERRREIATKLEKDLDEIRRQRGRLTGDESDDALGVGRITRAFQGLDNAMRTILPGIGLGFVTAGVGLSGFVANLNQAYERMHAIGIASRSIAAGVGGLGSGFVPALSQELQALQHQTGRTPDQLAMTASAFTPILPGGEAGGTQAGVLTEQAMGLGKFYGVAENVVATTMVKLRQLDDVPTELLGDRFNDLASAARDAHRPVVDYIADVTALTEQTRRYGIGLTDNMRLVSLFSRELQDGVVSIQDLTKLQIGFAQAGEGERAFAMNQILQRGLVSGDLAGRMQAVSGNAVALQRLGQRIIQTGGPEAEQLNRAVHLLAEQMGQEMGRGQPSAVQAELVPYIEDKLREQFGVLSNPSIQAAESLKEAALGHKQASKGLMDAGEKVGSAAEAVERGMGLIRDTMTPGQKAKQWWNERWENIWLGVSTAAKGTVNPSAAGETIDAWQRNKVRSEMMRSLGKMGTAGPEEQESMISGLMDLYDKDNVAFESVLSEFKGAERPVITGGEVRGIAAGIESRGIARGTPAFMNEYNRALGALERQKVEIIITNLATHQVSVRSSGAGQDTTAAGVERNAVPAGAR